jgi:DNA invertase Pin-like site-specific DNA recombinase
LDLVRRARDRVRLAMEIVITLTLCRVSVCLAMAHDYSVINLFDMHCLIYVRVSTDRQAEKELSLPAQLQACQQYARERDWKIVETFIEPGVSARTADRPELQRLMARSRDRQPAVDLVLVHKLDRLARNVADHAAIRAILAKRKIRVVSVSENLEDSISGHLVENVLAAINEFYSANLSQEVRKGMRQKVLQGGWPHAVPRGYKFVADETGRRRPVPDLNAQAIRWAFEDYASGNRSLRQISEGLEVRGLRTVSGTALSQSQIQVMLSNPFYMGRLAWGDLNVPGLHEPLITPELFEQAQQMRRKRHHWTGIRGRLPGFPLRRLAVCGSYGGGMLVERHKGGRFGYYRCLRQQRDRRLCRSRYCNADRMHRNLDEICQQISTDSAWNPDVLLPADDGRKQSALRKLFSAVTLTPEGVSSFTLKQH